MEEFKMNLQEFIENEMKKNEEKCIELSHMNEEHYKLIEELTNEYIETDKEGTSDIPEQIQDINHIIEMNNLKIKELRSSSNIIIQKRIFQEIKKCELKMHDIENEIKARCDKLKPAHEKLLKELCDLVELNKKTFGIANYLNYWFKNLTNDSLREKTEGKYEYHIYFGGNSCKYINELLIEGKDIYKN